MQEIIDKVNDYYKRKAYREKIRIIKRREYYDKNKEERLIYQKQYQKKRYKELKLINLLSWELDESCFFNKNDLKYIEKMKYEKM